MAEDATKQDDPGLGPGSAGVSPASVMTRRNLGVSPPEWRSRGYLPHRDAPGSAQMVTFRLADSLPAAVVEDLRRERFPKGDAERRARAEAYLDAGHGACHLRDPAVADLVERTLLRFDGERYRLLAWRVMPNHVHVLVELLPPQTIAKVLHAWKSYTAHAANRMLGRSGAFWQIEYWDRYIRDGEHSENAVAYIHENQSRFSSAARVRREGHAERKAGETPALPADRRRDEAGRRT